MATSSLKNKIAVVCILKIIECLPAACKGVHRSRSLALTSPRYSINNFNNLSLLSIEH
jgi:hypothetical protein